MDNSENTEAAICNEIIRLIHRADWASCSGVSLDKAGGLSIDYSGETGERVPRFRDITHNLQYEHPNITRAEIDKHVAEIAAAIYRRAVAIYEAKNLIVNVNNAYHSLDLDWTTAGERAQAISAATGINAAYNDELGFSDYKSGDVTLRIIDHLIHGVGSNHLELESHIFVRGDRITSYTPITGRCLFSSDDRYTIAFEDLQDGMFRKL